MQLLYHKLFSQNFLNRLFDATVCYLRTLIPDISVGAFPHNLTYSYLCKNHLSFLDGYSAGRPNVVTYHDLLNLDCSYLLSF